MDEGNRSGEDKFIIFSPRQFRFEPGAASWTFCFALLADFQEKVNPKLRALYINGFNTEKALLRRPNLLPLNRVERSILNKAKKLKKFYEKTTSVNLNSWEQFELITLRNSLSKTISSPGKYSEIKINPAKIPFEFKKGRSYPVRVEIETDLGVLAFNTVIFIISLPFDVNWKPAQLHVHSTLSDGKKSPAELAEIYRKMGYKILYITDHADLVLQNTQKWSIYEDMIMKTTTPEMSVYAGLEITTHNSKGDVLAYGICSLSELENGRSGPQEAINNVYKNTSQSSAAVAHPCGTIDWEDWSVINYSGFEIMSSILQINYGSSARPTVRWISELCRLMPESPSSCFPSARAGDDWHATVFEPVPPGYVTYLYAPYWKSKSSVDRALLKGKSVASRFGGLGYFQLYIDNLKKNIGDIIKKVPSETIIKLLITFKPVLTGNYKIKIIRDNTEQEEFSTSYKCTGGYTYYIEGSLIFPGARYFYYLYITGPDHVYSSPIFVYR